MTSNLFGCKQIFSKRSSVIVDFAITLWDSVNVISEAGCQSLSTTPYHGRRNIFVNGSIHNTVTIEKPRLPIII